MKNFADLLKYAEKAKRIVRNHPKDMNTSNDEDIINHFRKLISLNRKPQFSIEQQFYVGITKDIKSNLSRHNIDYYVGCVKVGNKEVASRIEEQLHTNLGVYIGKGEQSSAGRGADVDSVIVYLADRKTPGFKD